MTQFDEVWSSKTKAIFNGVLMYSIAGILHSILDPISDLGSTASFFMSSSDLRGLSAFCNILLVCIILGYIIYLVGLNGFSKILTPGDNAAVRKVYTSVILVIVAEIFEFIPLMGFLTLSGWATIKNTIPSKEPVNANYPNTQSSYNH